MRIVAIGLGGAGSRIVDRLYAVDRKSSRIACVQGVAVDIEEEELRSLSNLPDSARLCFPTQDPQLSGSLVQDSPATAIDIGEIISKIQNFESGETDAIVIFLGLGGTLTDAAPHLITGLRSVTTEPIFGFFTLPCLAEGEKRSVRAADGIDMLEPLLDGIILFDNETWYKKTASQRSKILNQERGFIEKLVGKQEQDLSPRMLAYRLLNDSIVRRISLILKAGEFRADGGIDLAEVVLDSGEVLNTMRGMGFITIGYAVEQTESSPFGFLNQLRPKGALDEEHKKKASRIVELAKQAIYHEISTPCDMTSAHKALILVAGPTHELSMKGFMTVRKWIDRSIAGLETRSGDYPVINTKNVAIIVMLSGLENIPRVGELREIRDYYRNPSFRAGAEDDRDNRHDIRETRSHGDLSDEMIVLPPTMKKTKDEEFRVPESAASHTGSPPYEQPLGSTRGSPTEAGAGSRPGTAVPDTHEVDLTGTITIPEGIHPHPKHTRPVITPPDHTAAFHKTDLEPPAQEKHPDTPPTVHQQKHPQYTKPEQAHSPKVHQEKPHETPRQKVERELERQRIIAAPERIIRTTPEKPHHRPVSIDTTQSKPQIPLPRHSTVIPGGKPVNRPTVQTDTVHVAERKTIIIRKKNQAQAPDKPLPQSPVLPKQEKYHPSDETEAASQISDEKEQQVPPVRNSVEMKDVTFRAKDQVFDGKLVQKGSVPMPRDSVLLKANLHLGKKVQKKDADEPKPSETGHHPEELSGHQKITTKTIKKREDGS